MSIYEKIWIWSMVLVLHAMYWVNFSYPMWLLAGYGTYLAILATRTKETADA